MKEGLHIVNLKKNTKEYGTVLLFIL